ncbi:MAG: TrkH family potassium uptake protein, partial [Alphaproteobacteria bacterium]|nr:TrkH family potassium uptake protein [Alphaproteobacteria bacterium]
TFNIISVITTTGMGSTEFLDWGIWTAVFFTILSMHGGCNGSTTGSIKVMRWQVLKSYFHKLIVTSIEPNRVVPIKVGEVSVNENVINSVFLYVFLFFVTIGLTAVTLNFIGYDFTTSVSAAIASVTNTGPGITTSIGVMGNYAFFSTLAKYVLCAAMILGRLEIITVLVVFTKAFWKK